MSELLYECPKCKSTQMREVESAGLFVHRCSKCGQLNVIQVTGRTAFEPQVTNVTKSKKQLYETTFDEKLQQKDLRLLLNANLMKVRCLNEALQMAKVALKKRAGTKRVLTKIHKLENGAASNS